MFRQPGYVATLLSPKSQSNSSWVAKQREMPHFLRLRTDSTCDMDGSAAVGKTRRFIRKYLSYPMCILICAQLVLTICAIEGIIEAISVSIVSLTAFICICYAVEVGIRVFGFRWSYVRSFWFGLDLCTVVAGVINVCVRAVLLTHAGRLDRSVFINILLFTGTVMNLRILRIIRFFKNVRHNPRFLELWFVSRSLVAATKMLSWVSVFICGVILFYGMVGAELIGNNDFLINHSTEEISTLVEEKFGNVAMTMLSCLQVVLLDSWSSQLAGPLLVAQSKEATSGGRFRLVFMACYFISLVALGAMILMNMLNAVIVERSIQYGKDDEETRFVAEQIQWRRLAHDIKGAFHAADLNGDNSLTLDEVMAACEDPASKARPYLLQMGTIDEVMRVFRLLDVDDSGELAIEEFCDGMLRCKQDFNKLLLWQILERQSVDRAQISYMNKLLVGFVGNNTQCTTTMLVTPPNDIPSDNAQKKSLSAKVALKSTSCQTPPVDSFESCRQPRTVKNAKRRRAIPRVDASLQALPSWPVNDVLGASQRTDSTAS